MAVQASTNVQISEESSTEEYLQDSLEENTMPDSGMSEGSSEVSAVSVSEEIKRFQQEINNVAVENVKYPSWKQQRLGEKRRSASVENLLDSDLDRYQNNALDLPPRGQCVSRESILAPKLPPKKKNGQKRVSYAKNEVTMLGSLEEIPAHISSVSKVPEVCYNRSLERSRQIQPSSHIAPAEPTTADNDELNSSINTAHQPIRHDGDGDENENDVEDFPVLPSVKQLATRFQVMRAADSKPRMVTKKDRLDKVAEMLKVNKPSGSYAQVHSITARSVSRQFRESLKNGKAEQMDAIFKLPEAKQNMGTQETVKNTNNIKANIIYKSSEPRNLYPNGYYIRTSGPDCSGIAAFGIRRGGEEGYSSDSESDGGRRRW